MDLHARETDRAIRRAVSYMLRGCTLRRGMIACPASAVHASSCPLVSLLSSSGCHRSLGCTLRDTLVRAGTSVHLRSCGMWIPQGRSRTVTKPNATVCNPPHAMFVSTCPARRSFKYLLRKLQKLLYLVPCLSTVPSSLHATFASASIKGIFPRHPALCTPSPIWYRPCAVTTAWVSIKVAHNCLSVGVL